ncbi:microsomal epoxide hydrolase [Xylaria bambusicola]|uniref:microsomal epoxide hydrolase n=1 Tax=Xylaria bambusicola TaxID=326684 RepID=UPI002007D5A9|nr:microsomal epoxide hydrolase [Xylaria bambusicola]KAI0527746.1 microsomal epoxide hydrolase [Xylaria bambusicola]
MANIRPYKISISESQIQDLKTRLSLSKFPDELDNAGWDMGAPLADIKRLTRHWESSYSWKTAEAELNSLPHFITDIQCDGFQPLAIHFVHIRSKVQNAIPLLWIHGWPGHFWEGVKIMKPLTEGDGVEHPAFDLVVPSLPNFAFSEGTKERGFALAQYAETLNKLMLKLGYNEYVTQGGDWGTHISRALAHLYPQTCKATHLSMDAANPPSFLANPVLTLQHMLTPYSKREREGQSRTEWFTKEGRGYNLEQSTKPQTLGYALVDSPVACLSWIYEKLHDWTDNYPWTDDEVCTWVSIYWFSVAGPAASTRIYYETHHTTRTPENPRAVPRDMLRAYSPGVKLGYSHFPMDLVVLPSTWVRTLGNVVFERDHEDGGHFAAWERPGELVKDLRDMFGKKGGAFGCVKGANGYSQ